jgi:hypothetical protein
MLKNKLKSYFLFSEMFQSAEEIWKKEILQPLTCGNRSDIEDESKNIEKNKRFLDDDKKQGNL